MFEMSCCLCLFMLHDFRRYPDKISCWVQVDILVVNCSLFNPTPSLSAMIINHFKMRSNIVSYNLAGMGCSAGVIAVNLAKELLQASLHIDVLSLLLLACTVCVRILLNLDRPIGHGIPQWLLVGIAILLRLRP